MGHYVGQTTFGDGHSVRAIVRVRAIPKADKPALLALEAVDDSGLVTVYYLWIDDTGAVRVNNAVPTDQNSDGTSIAQVLISGTEAADDIAVTQIGSTGIYKGSTTITVSGASTGDKVFVGVNSGTDAADLWGVSGFVSADDTVTVQFLATQATSVNVGFSYVIVPS